jgi:hypothetical protein
LQHLTSRRLQLNIVADKTRLDQDLFLNLGLAQNLSLDLSAAAGNRSQPAVELDSPASSYRPNVPNTVFLADLRLGRKYMLCNCDTVG